jgi:hypothetical protein
VDCKTELTVKTPKKKDLSVCNNWKEVCLLSTISKEFTKILLTELLIARRRLSAGNRHGLGLISHVRILYAPSALSLNNPLNEIPPPLTS